MARKHGMDRGSERAEVVRRSGVMDFKDFKNSDPTRDDEYHEDHESENVVTGNIASYFAHEV